MAFKGAVKAELIAGALHGLQANYARAYKVVNVTCPDCNGISAPHRCRACGGTGEAPDGTGCPACHATGEIAGGPPCPTCNSTGQIQMAEGKLPDEMPNDLKPYFQEYKLGRQGRLIPVFVSKQALLDKVILLTGADKAQTRTPWGTDMTPEQQAEREAELTATVATVSKDMLIEQLLQLLASPNASAAEKLKAVDQIAVLRGYKTDGDNGHDDEPASKAPWER